MSKPDFDLRSIPCIPGQPPPPSGGLPATPGAVYKIAFTPDSVTDGTVGSDGIVICGEGIEAVAVAVAVVEDGKIIGFNRAQAQ